MKERLHAEFKIVLDDIIDEPRKTTTSLDDLQASGDKMRKRLENIGEINPTAVEAFTEIKNATNLYWSRRLIWLLPRRVCCKR